jgi:hypothetical protein
MVGRHTFSDNLESYATYSTLRSVDGFTKNEIDHLFIDGRHASDNRDMRSCRDADCDTDCSLCIY